MYFIPVPNPLIPNDLLQSLENRNGYRILFGLWPSSYIDYIDWPFHVCSCLYKTDPMKQAVQKNTKIKDSHSQWFLSVRKEKNNQWKLFEVVRTADMNRQKSKWKNSVKNNCRVVELTLNIQLLKFYYWKLITKCLPPNILFNSQFKLNNSKSWQSILTHTCNCCKLTYKP